MPQADARKAGGPKARWWRGLVARSTLAIGFMLAGLALVIILTTAIHARGDYVASAETALAGDADRIAATLVRGEFTAARFADVASGLDTAYAYLVGEDGSILAGVGPDPSPPAFSPEAAIEARDAGLPAIVMRDGAMHALKPLTLEDGREAVLRLGRRLDGAAAAARDTISLGLLATLGFLALALPAAAIGVDHFAAPLRALTRAVTRPGASQDEVQRAGGRDDEIGALARAHLSIAKNLAENADALHRLTFDDPLTRLPNRGSLMSRLTAALQVGRAVALIKIEVEGLARVSVGLGHRHGDEAILVAADRLRDAAADWAASSPEPNGARGAEPAAMLARLSDSAFAYLAFGADPAAADSLARYAVEAFRAPLRIDEHEVALSLAVGLAIGPQDGDEASALMRSAGAALSAAKSAGVNAIRCAGAELNQRAYGRLRLEQDLRKAIENGDIEVHFQPQIALTQRVCSGAEALARWRHPTRGMVPPFEFIPIAEECGLIEPLGRLVLAEACRQSAAWTGMGMDLRIAVNVSTMQFRHPRFAETTIEIIRASGADTSRIELEITESAAMGDPAHASRELAPLKDAGVRIAIDDFGTGYSNLATLTQLPFDVLKIDRAFVRDAIAGGAARVVVGAVVGIAENLDFETVAEGVETVEQLELVTGLGCTYGQGYLFGKPMAAAAFEAWYALRIVTELKALGERAAPAPRTAAWSKGHRRRAG